MSPKEEALYQIITLVTREKVQLLWYVDKYRLGERERAPHL